MKKMRKKSKERNTEIKRKYKIREKVTKRKENKVDV